jgi:hypothetical protein
LYGISSDGDDDCDQEGEYFDCYDMVVDYVEGLESCYYFESCDECSVFAYANGEEVTGDCADLMEMHGIPD